MHTGAPGKIMFWLLAGTAFCACGILASAVADNAEIEDDLERFLFGMAVWGVMLVLLPIRKGRAAPARQDSRRRVD